MATNGKSVATDLRNGVGRRAPTEPTSEEPLEDGRGMFDGD